MKYLLDTSVYSQPIKRNPHPQVVEYWGRLAKEDYVTSTVCHAEMLRGLESKGSPEMKQRYAYYLQDKVTLLSFDEDCAFYYAKIYAALGSEGVVRETEDLFIAATARAHGLILATLNAKHFAGIEGLAVEDWSR